MKTELKKNGFEAMSFAEMERTNGGSIKVTLEIIIESIRKIGTLWA
ncbi:MAG: hypothetical protein LLF81_03775 [Porphyromonadaceae bacterium]|nr:hypothetical protein [Porphyromonadaceae bacterium]